MTSTNFFTGLIIIFFSQFLSQSYTPEPPTIEPTDASILSQEPCVFPCWNGLIPGLSTLEEVEEAINHIDFISKSRGIDYSEWTDKTFIMWWYSDRTKSNYIELADGVIHYIKIIPNISFDLGEIIDIYGEPDFLMARFHSSTSSPLPNRRIDLSLFYAEYGLRVFFEIPILETDTEVIVIDENIKGVSFRLYQSQTAVDQFIADVFSYELEKIDQLLTSFETLGWLGWPGFGAIIEIDKYAYLFPDRPLFIRQSN